MSEPKPNSAIVIVGRKASNFRGTGLPIPSGSVLYKCAVCGGQVAVSPGGDAQMKATALEMAQAGTLRMMTVLCSECALKATLPADTTIVPTARGAERLQQSAEVREYLTQLEARKKTNS